MAEHNIVGVKGEQIAKSFLESQGYNILETNWRFKNLEADIIAERDKTLVLAEVKTRKSTYFGEPETFVNKQKQKNLVKAANEYVLKNNLNMDVRFDIISIVYVDDQKTKITHLKDAFYPTI